MIELSPTKEYAYIKIEIYHNNNNIDFESIREEFESNLNYLYEKEKKVLEGLK
jgi:hypothetical protein